ncbi:MAG: hypothetical protein OES25_08530 [Acidobacteriota bacterium]|nr:hypothetical protein [Acidobacteriota bacterium]
MSNPILLLSAGGLDSCVTAHRLVTHGFEVHALHFETGFIPESRRKTLQCGAWERLGVTTTTVLDGRAIYARGLRQPGGGPSEPCLDGRVQMLRQAAAEAERRGIRWLATADVVGQRRTDQTRRRLLQIDRDAGVSGRVGRPLANHSLPLEDPIFDRLPRSELHGTSRRFQLRWAETTEGGPWPAPHAGCCRLADRGVAVRARDLFAHTRAQPTDDELLSLSLGRHYRLGHAAKAIVPRNHVEGRQLEALFPAALRGCLREAAGPSVYLLGDAGPRVLRDLASLVLGVHRRPAGSTATVTILKDGSTDTLVGTAPESAGVELWRV